jgi:hypothetical protein
MQLLIVLILFGGFKRFEMSLDDIRHLKSGDVEDSRDVDFSAGFIAFDNVNRIILQVSRGLR